MRKLPTATAVGLVVLVVAGLGAIWAWERQGNAITMNLHRRQAIEREFQNNGLERGAAYGTSLDQESPDSWRAATLVLGCAALCGGLSAAWGWSSRPGEP